MTQTSSGKTQGSLNIINVKNTLKACSIRVKQCVLFILEHQFYQGVLPFGSENFMLHEFCVKFIKKKHRNDGYCKYFVTFALDYENMN